MPLDFSSQPLLLPHTFALSPVAPAAMVESSSSPLELLLHHIADPDRSFQPAGYCSSSLFSLFQTALEVTVPDVVREILLGNGPMVKLPLLSGAVCKVKVVNGTSMSRVSRIRGESKNRTAVRCEIVESGTSSACAGKCHGMSRSPS